MIGLFQPLIFWTEFFRVLLLPPPPRRSAEIVDLATWRAERPPIGRRSA